MDGMEWRITTQGYAFVVDKGVFPHICKSTYTVTLLLELKFTLWTQGGFRKMKRTEQKGGTSGA